MAKGKKRIMRRRRDMPSEARMLRDLRKLKAAGVKIWWRPRYIVIEDVGDKHGK